MLLPNEGIYVLIRMLIKELISWTPLSKYLFPFYQYNFSPQQLIFLCSCLKETQYIYGDILEIGCFDGRTTVFLNTFINDSRFEKRYYAIDTFSGFVQADVEYEIANRGKMKDEISGFRINRIKWFEKTMKRNEISRVVVIRTDVDDFKFESIGPISFALLDMDLYRPTKKSLREVYNTLSPGGIIVVDDCTESESRWDGAYQAYREFTEESGYLEEVVFGKLGVIRKPS